MLFRSTAIPTSLNILGECFSYLFVHFCRVQKYSNRGSCYAWLTRRSFHVCMHAWIFLLALLCDPWHEGWVLKHCATLCIKADGRAFVEHFLLMLLRHGEVISRWTSVAFVITGLKYSTSLLYQAKVFASSSLVASYIYMAYSVFCVSIVYTNVLSVKGTSHTEMKETHAKTTMISQF